MDHDGEDAHKDVEMAEALPGEVESSASGATSASAVGEPESEAPPRAPTAELSASAVDASAAAPQPEGEADPRELQDLLRAAVTLVDTSAIVHGRFRATIDVAGEEPEVTRAS